MLSEEVNVYTRMSTLVPAEALIMLGLFKIAQKSKKYSLSVDLITLGLHQIVQVAQNRLKTLKND